MGLPAGMRRTRDVLVFLAKFVITYAGGRKYLAVFGVCFPMLVFLMMVALGATLHKLGAKAGTPSLLGAIFSDNIDTYNCNMREAYKALDKVVWVYNQRTSSLATAMSTASRSNCATVLGNAQTSLRVILNANKNIIGVTAPQTTANLDTIKTYADNLKITNTNLQRLSCPEVY